LSLLLLTPDVAVCAAIVVDVVVAAAVVAAFDEEGGAIGHAPKKGDAVAVDDGGRASAAEEFEEDPSINLCTLNLCSRSVSDLSAIIDWMARRLSTAADAAAAASTTSEDDDDASWLLLMADVCVRGRVALLFLLLLGCFFIFFEHSSFLHLHKTVLNLYSFAGPCFVLCFRGQKSDFFRRTHIIYTLQSDHFLFVYL
jgi:hypothetical protein